MAFVPHSRGAAGGRATLWRTLLFWLLTLFLAVVLWQAASRNGRSDQGSKLSYSDFMNQVDDSNIETANFRVMQNAADVSGRLKHPASDYHSTVARDTLSALLDKLRREGTDVQITEGAPQQSWVNFLVGVAPIILLVVLWMVMVRRIEAKQNTNLPNQPTPGALG